MEQRIVDNANKYKELAEKLADMKVERNLDGDIPEDVQAAFIRLYYAKAFEIEIEKCEALLDEETDEETVTAVTEAAGAVEAAAESAFGAIENYVARDTDFAERIEDITMSTETEGIMGSLIKLYKCEQIIRTAQRCSMKYPLYGVPSSILGVPQESNVTMDAEEEIRQRLGVDIYELLELRQGLVSEIGGIIEGNSIT